MEQWANGLLRRLDKETKASEIVDNPIMAVIRVMIQPNHTLRYSAQEALDFGVEQGIFQRTAGRQYCLADLSGFPACNGTTTPTGRSTPIATTTPKSSLYPMPNNGKVGDGSFRGVIAYQA